ncbi:MAG: two-component sensor histidine kinase [Flavisolibacter sp.]|nr:two-component sensor histidine kinase [Flavisolibacter sp.]
MLRKQLTQQALEREMERMTLINKQKEELEEQVLERTSELKQSLNELKSTQVQLIQKEKMASLGEITAGIAHEIQNPLNFINNFSEVSFEMMDEVKQGINTGNSSEALDIADAVKDNLQKITHYGKRADSIVKRMLEHSRSDAAGKEPTDINALAEECLKLTYHAWRAKDQPFIATLQTQFDTSIGKVNVVAQDISRVLLNLLNNAFYAVSEKRKKLDSGYEPVVLIGTKRLEGKIEIWVRDNGIGIPRELLGKIYQPFFTTKPIGEGVGLGLSLSYDIIAKGHGGEMKVDMKEGEYTEFVMQLPV